MTGSCAAYSHSDGKYRMKQLFRGGYPDRATGLGMTSNFANYDGRRDRDDIHLSLNARSRCSACATRSAPAG